ncbi:hypothetical protein BMS3Abin13_00313 [bacterium BMS3Abin13]|nr:hypothetical protein BMS3Abin13_00313 [bacterium BMS3Abin13]
MKENALKKDQFCCTVFLFCLSFREVIVILTHYFFFQNYILQLLDYMLQNSSIYYYYIVDSVKNCTVPNVVFQESGSWKIFHPPLYGADGFVKPYRRRRG